MVGPLPHACAHMYEGPPVSPVPACVPSHDAMVLCGFSPLGFGCTACIQQAAFGWVGCQGCLSDLRCVLMCMCKDSRTLAPPPPHRFLQRPEYISVNTRFVFREVRAGEGCRLKRRDRVLWGVVAFVLPVCAQ